MRLAYLLSLPALIALFVAGCKSPASVGKVVYPPDQIVPTEKSLLWKISGNGLKKPSYLYGTIHMIPKSRFEVSEKLRLAIDQTKRVTFEIDMREMTNILTQFSLMTKAFMGGGKTLKDLLPAEDYQFVRAKMDEKGLPGGMMERMKPMFLSMMFSADEDGGSGGMLGGNAKVTSVEMEIYKMARRRKMESAGLETTGYQMSIFDSIPYEAQAKMLVETLRNSEVAGGAGDNELDKMVDMYLQEDITAMQSMISADDMGFGQYEDIFLNKRNRNWIPVMGRMMTAKPTLFAVGAGHLGGKSGVIALLRAEGYRVDAVR